ncbi:MAG: sulfatase-like hydrolase/transferase, partial [Deltaproteobacteria bacterium]|nr:sulfatase-like hydrolase/transferase [Deltaproteobacteria bacterium]
DYFYGNLVGEVDYFTKDRGGIIDWQRNGTFLKEDGYYTELIGDEAVKIIEQDRGEKPLFLYFASLAPHSPYEVPKKYFDLYPSIQDTNRRTYAAMITALDDQVGRIREALEKKGMLENTLIIFTSDNAGPINPLFATGARSPNEREKSGWLGKDQKTPVSNSPFSGGKGSLHEGGVRVPALWFWPSKLKPHSVEAVMGHADLMPTLLSLAGATGSGGHPFDGKNMWPALTEAAPSPHEDILINVEAVRGAVRKGNWKLIKWAAFPGKTELYDLSKDPGEKNNLAEKFPEVTRDLEARLMAYAQEQKTSEWIKVQPQFLGAQGKTVFDPDFDIDDGGLPREKPNLPSP